MATPLPAPAPRVSPLKRSQSHLLLAKAACLLAAFALFTPSEAATPRQLKEAELTQLRGRITSLRSNLNKVRNRYDAMRIEMRDIEQRIATLRSNVQQLDTQLQTQQGKLRALEQKQRRSEEALALQRDHLARQVRAAYISGQQEYLKLLLNQQEPAAVGRITIYYDYLNRARNERIAAIQHSLDELNALAATVAAERASLQSLRDKADSERSELEESRGKRTQLLARMKNEISNKDQQLTRLEGDEKEMQRLLAGLSRALEDIPIDVEGKPFAALKGKLAWPAKGPFLIQYGTPRKIGTLTWQGVLIGAGEGTQVRAVSHGRVAFAEWLKGYGLLIILDHGGGYMSLYGYNQTLYKSVGDWVKGGEVIAAVGSSGGQEQNGLYFEIRQNGRPANPSLWCRR